MREDRDGNGVPDVLDAAVRRPAPAPPQPSSPSSSPHAGLIVAGGVFGTMLIGAATFFLIRLGAPSVDVERVPVMPTPSSRPTLAPVPSKPPLPAPLREPSPPEPPPKAQKPAPKLTNEQFGKNVVAAQAKKLRGCVEQDLLRNPDVPKAYTVTVLVEKDGLPRNSATTFSPTPTKGFYDCARFVIFYGFSGYGRNSPELVEYTFSTGFAFPDAKPAAKAELGRGWD